jgi:hypothetical protein
MSYYIAMYNIRITQSEIKSKIGEQCGFSKLLNYLADEDFQNKERYYTEKYPYT